MPIILSIVRRIRILFLNNLPWEVERRQLLEQIDRFEARQEERLAALRRRVDQQSDKPPDEKEA